MPNWYILTPQSGVSRLLRGLWLAASLALVMTSSASAQEYFVIGNQYVFAKVVTDNGSLAGGGRIVIGAGQYHGGHLFLYDITSNVVFKVRQQTGDLYYTNAKANYGAQPMIDPTTPVQYKPFDSIYTSPDTVLVFWNSVGGYNIVMRLIPEKPTTTYDRGTDILIEFSYEPIPLAFPGELGIFMMLDTYNGQATGSGGSGDRSSIITTRGYFPVDGPGKIFRDGTDSVPEFYHVGNFLHDPPLNTVLPIHRLRGISHAGRPLTTPSLFAVGNWRVFRFLSWDVGGNDVASTNLGDCATISRWDKLTGRGTIRTAFGMDDREGNNVYHCRDENLFVDIRTIRVVEQSVRNGPYSPPQFDAEMWLTNTSNAYVTATITLMEPIGAPDFPGRLARDGSTPQVQIVTIARNETKKLRWRLNVNQATTDTLVDIPLDFRFQLAGMNQPRVFKLPCNPMIAIKGYHDVVPPPPPRDTLPPPIVRVSKSRQPWPTWTFQTFDRHPGYIHDTGLDSIVVLVNEGANFRFTVNPLTYQRCDTTETVTMALTIFDSTKGGRLVFKVRDCYGNTSYDSVIYSPRPDIFRPRIDTVYLSGSAGPPCNAREFAFHLSDSLNQTMQAGDNGLGLIRVLGPLDNFESLEVNYHRGNAPILDFDKSASFRLRVIDSMFDASATIMISDYAGNSDTIQVRYCTLPDTAAPIAIPVGTKTNNEGVTSWSIVITDSLPWDRGLAEVVELANTNMTFIPPGIKSGTRADSFEVAVQDESMDASITLEVRDRIYAANPAGHADTVTLTFTRIPDTLAPNIIYHPFPGSNGALVDVEVNDVHFFGTERYPFDRGLKIVNILRATGNLQIMTQPQFAPGDTATGFRFRVIDTLAFHQRDTICVEAIDVYGNRSEACYIYPLAPDTLAPIFTGAMDDGRTTITAMVSDARLYDRGLGSVTLENAVNITLSGPSLANLNGVPTAVVTATVGDPDRPVAGTFVVRDLISQREPTSETEAIHAVRIPFLLPAAHLRLELPPTVEGGGDIVAAIIAGDTIRGNQLMTLHFEADFNGAVYKGGYNSGAYLTVTPSGSSANGRLDITVKTDGAMTYLPGDTLGTLLFGAGVNNSIQLFEMHVDTASLQANNNTRSTTTAQKLGDSARSVLILPPPFFRIVADSTTYINGDCERILVAGHGGRSKLNGLAILSVRPQPAVASGGSMAIDIRQLPAEGAVGELVSATGQTVQRFEMRGANASVVRVTVPLPADLAPGVYFLRLSAGMEHASVKIVVAD